MMAKFIVSGRGSFPISMLRHDECWPAADTDANAIEASFSNPRVRWSVTLYTARKASPTVGRWDSFNVKIVAGED